MPQTIPVITSIGSAIAGSGASIAAANVVGGAVVAGTVATGVSLAKTAAAGRATQAAVRKQVQSQRLAVARERRQAIRGALMARAQAANVAAATGQQGASGFQGGMTALQSQLGANLGYGGVQSQLGQQYTSLTGRAAQLQGQGQLFGQIGQMAFSAIPYAGQISSGLNFADSMMTGSGGLSRRATFFGGQNYYNTSAMAG